MRNADQLKFRGQWPIPARVKIPPRGQLVFGRMAQYSVAPSVCFVEWVSFGHSIGLFGLPSVRLTQFLPAHPICARLQLGGVKKHLVGFGHNGEVATVKIGDALKIRGARQCQGLLQLSSIVSHPH